MGYDSEAWSSTISAKIIVSSRGVLLKALYFLVGLKFILIYKLNKLYLLQVQPINLRHE
jgi:hypothetical protein